MKLAPDFWTSKTTLAAILSTAVVAWGLKVGQLTAGDAIETIGVVWGLAGVRDHLAKQAVSKERE